VRPALLLLAVALLAGCSAAPAPERAAPRLTATLERSRNAENLHRVQVLLASDREVGVRRVQVRGGGYTEVPPTVWDQLVRPGRPDTGRALDQLLRECGQAAMRSPAPAGAG
jgi:hypothetical protein